jgi:hypothetical protein
LQPAHPGDARAFVLLPLQAGQIAATLNSTIVNQHRAFLFFLLFN